MLTDADGNFTGERGVGYAEAVQAEGNISSANGAAQTEQFGTDINYDRTILLPGTDWEIDEKTVLFIDEEPTYSGTNPEYNYKVVRVAKSLNHTALAVSKVR